MFEEVNTKTTIFTFCCLIFTVYIRWYNLAFKMEDELSEISSDSGSVIKLVRTEEWYRKHLLKSGRFVILAFTCYTALIVFDIDSFGYEGCASLYDSDYIVQNVFVAFRISFVFISFLSYYIISRSYDHSVGVALFVMGIFIFSLCLFIREDSKFCVYVRMCLDLPVRFFGLTYIQALLGAVVHNWTFYGKELLRFHRIWMACVQLTPVANIYAGRFLCAQPLADGFPFAFLIHGSLLLGAGIFFVCAFQPEASADSLLTKKQEKETLEKDHMNNGYLSASESSLFKPMTFLKHVYSDGRHLIAIGFQRLADSVGIYALFHIILNKSPNYQGVLFVWLWYILLTLFWIVFCDLLENEFLQNKSLPTKHIVMSTIFFAFIFLKLFLSMFIVVQYQFWVEPPLSLAYIINFLFILISTYFSVNGPAIRGAFIKPVNNHKCRMYYVIHTYALTLFWGIPQYALLIYPVYNWLIFVLIADLFWVLGYAIFYIWEIFVLRNATKEKMKFNWLTTLKMLPEMQLISNTDCFAEQTQELTVLTTFSLQYESRKLTWAVYIGKWARMWPAPNRPKTILGMSPSVGNLTENTTHPPPPPSCKDLSHINLQKFCFLLNITEKFIEPNHSFSLEKRNNIFALQNSITRVNHLRVYWVLITVQL